MFMNHVRIYVYHEPVDMRRSFDGLALLVEQVMGQDARNGTLYGFINKRNNRLKLLWWDVSGYCLLYKRLHGHRFIRPEGRFEHGAVRLEAEALKRLLQGVEKKRFSTRKRT